MNDFIRHISWEEQSNDIQSLVKQDTLINMTPLDSGLEADVFKISTKKSMFVLKVWNRDSNPDILFQYKLLEDLNHQGIAVSKPLGWGIDKDNNQVLLTSFDGTPIHKVNKSKLIAIANILMEIRYQRTIDQAVCNLKNGTKQSHSW